MIMISIMTIVTRNTIIMTIGITSIASIMIIDITISTSISYVIASIIVIHYFYVYSAGAPDDRWSSPACQILRRGRKHMV